MTTNNDNNGVPIQAVAWAGVMIGLALIGAGVYYNLEYMIYIGVWWLGAVTAFCLVQVAD